MERGFERIARHFDGPDGRIVFRLEDDGQPVCLLGIRIGSDADEIEGELLEHVGGRIDGRGGARTWTIHDEPSLDFAADIRLHLFRRRVPLALYESAVRSLLDIGGGTVSAVPSRYRARVRDFARRIETAQADVRAKSE